MIRDDRQEVFEDAHKFLDQVAKKGDFVVLIHEGDGYTNGVSWGGARFRANAAFTLLKEALQVQWDSKETNNE